MKRGSRSDGGAATIGREEVSATTWIPFFSGFNDRLNSRRAQVDVIKPDGSTEKVFRDLPLQSVATTLGAPGTTSGVDVRAPNTISITVLQPPASLLTHKIDDVTRVYSWNDPSRNERGLEIETGDGSKTMLTLRG
ncbi:MAG: hypothetical protein EHM61_01800 [Acidobacteria bacterium]|nr:MAG: hypothetical protein EHM61_01800 [Acidobacteriota bacterium]